jgi:phenylalanyl-tRNA synthetase alpha chain
MIDIQKIQEDMINAQSQADLQAVFEASLGKNGSVTLAFKQLKDASPEEKKTLGAHLSSAKEILTQTYEDKADILGLEEINLQLQEDIVDISLTKDRGQQGTYSLLAKIRRDAEEICKSMGFIMEYGTEAVTKFENFEAVNIPLTHPATEMHDTIYLQEKDPQGENLILRTHTSAMQNFLIQKYGLPLKVVVPGKVYRYENMDASHDVMFYQLEGIVINKGLSIAHFKDTMGKLLSALLHKDVETRMRPGYFPFVEPGFEIDVRYDVYNPETKQMEKSKRMEILGAGMVHPNVLKLAGVDAEEWSGFAFGIGISRLAAVRYGIKDIRYFTNGDLRFAKSFE